MYSLGVLGLGKLGSPIAAVFAAAGMKVIGFDIDLEKVRLINEGKPPVCEPDLAETITAARQNLRAVYHLSELVEQTQACILVTPTPSEPNGDFDHGYLQAALIKMASKVRTAKKSEYGFIVSSTVMPEYLGGNVQTIIDSYLGSSGYRLVYKPEFIALGSVIRNLREPDFLLIGAEDAETRAWAEDLYRRMITNSAPACSMSLTEAELTKISLNCAITMRISFANQVAMVAEKIGADAGKVLNAIGMDKRVGHAVLRPGLPYGGPCFPRDNRMFSRTADRNGILAPLSSATDLVNQLIVKRIIQKIPVSGKVGILGMAYKVNTPLTEESAGAIIQAALVERGQTVLTHDVMAEHSHTMEEVIACETVVIACDWPLYRELRFDAGTLVIDPYGVTGARS